MRIGVHAGDFVPSVGGGYTFASQVIGAFIRLARESPHSFDVFVTAAPAAQLREALHENIEFHTIAGKGSLGSYLAALRRYSPLFAYLYRRPGEVERLAMRRGVELVWHLGGGAYDPLDIPYIATVWDVQHRTHPWFPEVSSNGRWDYREITHSAFLRRASFVITGTEIGAEQLGWYYQIPRERIRLLPHPTPLRGGTSRKPVAAPKLGEERPFVFYPAQFWAHKNHVNLLHAHAILRDRLGHDIDLALSGFDQGTLNHVQAVAAKLNLLSRIHFLGFVTTEELVYLYEHAAAMAYVPFSGPENLPPLEAFALGCPVVMSDYPGAREQAGDAAVFVNPLDPADIAKGIAGMLEDKELRGTMIGLGRKRANERDGETYVRGVFSILNEFEAIRRCWQ